VLGVHANSITYPVGIWHIINSGCIDKSGTCSIACYKYVFKQVDFSPFQKIVFFMVCGPHFRSYRVLSITMYSVSLKLDTSIKCLPECHATSIMDGLFAKMSGVMPQGAVRKRITTIEEAKQVFSEASAEQHELFTDAAKEQYYKFEPPAKEAVLTWLSEAKMLNGLLKTTYYWDAKVGRGRKQLIGICMNAFLLAAITRGARKLTDSPLDGRFCSPELSVDGVSDEHGEEAANRIEPVETDAYVWKGWGRSYRNVEPGTDGRSKVRGRLEATSDKLYDAVPEIVQRHKPIKSVLANRASVVARTARFQKIVKAAAVAYRT
jgi:hypothetical protein